MLSYGEEDDGDFGHCGAVVRAAKRGSAGSEKRVKERGDRRRRNGREARQEEEGTGKSNRTYKQA